MALPPRFCPAPPAISHQETSPARNPQILPLEIALRPACALGHPGLIRRKSRHLSLDDRTRYDVHPATTPALQWLRVSWSISKEWSRRSASHKHQLLCLPVCPTKMQSGSHQAKTLEPIRPLDSS